jgi:CRP-like cAMP-binding protein
MTNALPPGLSMETLTQKSKFFEFLDTPGRQRMLDLAQHLTFAADAEVVREGAVGDSFFVILRGSVRVIVDDYGTPKQVAVLGPGNLFGEMGVITDQTRSATVVAQGPLELLRFDKAPIVELLKGYPRVRELLAKMGMRRAEDTMEKMNALGDEPTPNPDA